MTSQYLLGFSIYYDLLIPRAQIRYHIAEKFKIIPKIKAGWIINELSRLAISETKRAGGFIIPGIGKLVLVEKKAHMGRNPATGEAIKIPAKTEVKMRFLKIFKEAVESRKK